MSVCTGKQRLLEGPRRLQRDHIAVIVLSIQRFGTLPLSLLETSRLRFELELPRVVPNDAHFDIGKALIGFRLDF